MSEKIDPRLYGIVTKLAETLAPLMTAHACALADLQQATEIHELASAIDKERKTHEEIRRPIGSYEFFLDMLDPLEVFDSKEQRLLTHELTNTALEHALNKLNEPNTEGE